MVGWLAGSVEFLVPMRLLTSVNLPENPSSVELSPRTSRGGLVMGIMTYTGPSPPSLLGLLFQYLLSVYCGPVPH